MTIDQWLALGLLTGFTVSGWCFALYWRRIARQSVQQIDSLLSSRYAAWERDHIAAMGPPNEPPTPFDPVDG